MLQKGARCAVLDDDTSASYPSCFGQRRTTGDISGGEQADKAKTCGGFDRRVEHGIKIDHVPGPRGKCRQHVLGCRMANGHAPHGGREVGIPVVIVCHAMRDHRREECRGLERFDTPMRADRMGGHDGVSAQAAGAIKKSIARL